MSAASEFRYPIEGDFALSYLRRPTIAPILESAYSELSRSLAAAVEYACYVWLPRGACSLRYLHDYSLYDGGPKVEICDCLDNVLARVVAKVNGTNIRFYMESTP